MLSQKLPLTNGPVSFEGALSLETTSEGVKPWRLPFEQLDLFEDVLLFRASQPSGVRLTFITNSRFLALEVEPHPEPTSELWTFDLLADGKLQDRQIMPPQRQMLLFNCQPLGPDGRATPQREQLLELYLPSEYCSLRIRSISVDARAAVRRWEDKRPRWVVYGSSITQAAEAAGPSETWPALVAQHHGLHLTSMGYGGQEHLEPMVARVIRDLPAHYISLCVGGNVQGNATLSARTFRPAVIGMVQIIREKHPWTPLAVVSFVNVAQGDCQPNVLGLTVRDYRRWTAEAVEILRRRGDSNVHYTDGMELFGPEYVPFLGDGVHPNATGYHLLARQYLKLVMPRLLAQPSRK